MAWSTLNIDRAHLLRTAVLFSLSWLPLGAEAGDSATVIPEYWKNIDAIAFLPTPRVIGTYDPVLAAKSPTDPEVMKQTVVYDDISKQIDTLLVRELSAFFSVSRVQDDGWVKDGLEEQRRKYVEQSRSLQNSQNPLIDTFKAVGETYEMDADFRDKIRTSIIKYNDSNGLDIDGYALVQYNDYVVNTPAGENHSVVLIIRIIEIDASGIQEAAALTATGRASVPEDAIEDAFAKLKKKLDKQGLQYGQSAEANEIELVE